MKKRIIRVSMSLVLLSSTLHAQESVGIGTDTPDPQSILDIQSTDRGILIPRLTTVERNAIATVASDEGLLIYNSSTSVFNYWDGTQWVIFPGRDEDWYEDGTPAGPPDDINDDIFTNGNVGIGLTAPDDALDVVGSVQFNGDFINQELLGVHSDAVQSVPFTNGVFMPLNGTVNSITPSDGNGINNSGVLILGFARVFGGNLTGGTSSMGGYFTILQRANNPAFTGAINLTYTSGTCYIQTPNGLGSAAIGYGGGGHISYVDNALVAGTTYYYRLVFYANGVGIIAGTYDIYQRDLNIVQLKR